MTSDIGKEIIDKADGVLVEVYKDAVSPVVKPIGEILGFLPRTLKLALSSWEKWLINGEETIRLTAESVREKIQAIPEEKLVEPESYVAIPAMQQLSYCVNNEELRELYANLLASSMNADKKWQVHPAFVDIIKQLTPDEAKYIRNLQPVVFNANELIDVRIEYDTKGSGTTIISNFTNVGLELLDLPQNIGSYIDNLERLKLIYIPPTMSLTNKELYESITTKNVLSVNTALDIVDAFVTRDDYIWCHATFDMPILDNLYFLAGRNKPWDYKKIRDIRTIVELSGIKLYSYNWAQEKTHDSLDDCMFQIKYTTDAMRIVKAGHTEEQNLERMIKGLCEIEHYVIELPYEKQSKTGLEIGNKVFNIRVEQMKAMDLINQNNEYSYSNWITED